MEAPSDTVTGDDADAVENEDGTTTKPDVEEVLEEAEETQTDQKSENNEITGVFC